jgi:DNA-binding response OmpR family regulator
VNEPLHLGTDLVPSSRVAEVRAEYARHLPERLLELLAAVTRARTDPGCAPALAAARRLLHQLKGSAPMFGCAAIGAGAARAEAAMSRLEHALPAQVPDIWSEVDTALGDVTRAVELAKVPGERRSPGVATARILVVDPDPDFLRRVTGQGLDPMVEVVCATTDDEAIERASRAPPDAALLDAGPGSSRLAHRLRQVPGCAALPIAFLSPCADLEDRIAAAQATASLFLPTPRDAAPIALASDPLVVPRRADQPHVLIVQGDADVCRSLAEILGGQQISATTLSEPSTLVEVVARERPDLVLLDARMLASDALDACRRLRADERWQKLPIFCLGCDTTPERRAAAFGAGVDEVLSTPVVAAELLSRVAARLSLLPR